MRKYCYSFLASLFSVAIFCAIWFGIELFLATLIPQKEVYRHPDESVVRFDPVRGWCLNDDGIYQTLFLTGEGGTPVYTATTTIKDGIRHTPTEDIFVRNKFIAFFGDSFTFGQDVNDDETLPYFIGMQNRQYRPYNFGVPGGSVQTLYYKLQTEDLAAQIGEKEGIGVYWFFPYHVRRAIGSMPMFNNWADKLWCYEVVEDDLLFRGTFREAHPYRSRIYDLLYASNVARYFKFYLPRRLQDEDYYLTARILIESAALFHATFPNSDFIVLFWGVNEPFEPVKEMLDAHGIKTVLLRELLNGKSSPMDYLNQQTPDGMHLLGEAYADIAKNLVTIF